MSTPSPLGDTCQNHNPMTAPVVYPHTVTRDRNNGLRAEYRCACGKEWPCWWDARAAGWPSEDDHCDVCGRIVSDGRLIPLVALGDERIWVCRDCRKTSESAA